jgi:hypothetical protein
MDQLFKLGKGLIKGGGHSSHHNGVYYDPNYPPQQHAGGHYPNNSYNQPGGYGGAPYGGAGGYQPDPYHGNNGYGQPAYGGYNNQPYGGYNNNQPHHGGGGIHGPMAIFKTFDKDGDGQITENGKPFCTGWKNLFVVF